MHVEYHVSAADRLDEYDQTDAELANLYEEIIVLLERDQPEDSGHWRLRHKMIRPAGAYVVKIHPRGRDRNYYLFWLPEQDQAVAFVKYVGPGSADI